MDIIRLDAHYFCMGYDAPDSDDIPVLIKCFSDEELMPQYFEEQGPVSKKKKMLSFVNPSTNRSIFFRSDRIVVSWALNPFEGAGNTIDDALKEFIRFAENSLRSYEGTIKGKLSSNRISLVGHFVFPYKNDPGKSPIAKVANEGLPWCDGNINEINIRTGQTERLEGFGEDINALVTVNDGNLETNTNGKRTQSPCFLSVLDLNTKPECQDFRFDIETASLFWNSLGEAVKTKTGLIKGFLEEGDS
ncbi:MAG: hypothetical protein ACQEXI_06135 [Pseudomonadota bacterium]